MQKNSRKILLISHETEIKPKLQSDPAPKMAKGFIRLGHDARQLSYTSLISQLSPFRNRTINRHFYKERVDQALCNYVKHYKPDIVFIGFSRGLDKHTVQALRAMAPEAIFFGWDGDLWPSNNLGRVEIGRELDILFATNNGSSLEEYRKKGAKKCLFMPNLIDPDIDRRYPFDERYVTNILWTGKIQHQTGIEAGERIRQEVLEELTKRSDTKIYGCHHYPKIGGTEYFHAISGARIGISINAVNTEPLYHSDRFTHYSAAGALVLAKRVPETNRLMEDKKHVCYFDSMAECIELADWYLNHESERKKIAEAGMNYCHETYNATQIASYLLDAIDSGEYEAPWGKFVAS